MVVGSRAHLEDDAIATRHWYRNFLMRGFHLLVLFVAGGSVRDTQCGFKVTSSPLTIVQAFSTFSTLVAGFWLHGLHKWIAGVLLSQQTCLFSSLLALAYYLPCFGCLPRVCLMKPSTILLSACSCSHVRPSGRCTATRGCSDGVLMWSSFSWRGVVECRWAK